MENWASPSFCHWDQSKNDVLLLIIGLGKNWAGPFFPPLEKWKHQPWADGYLGGEKTGPAHSFTTPTSENINHTLSWICKQSLLFRGWGKTGPAHSFPSLTRLNINLLLQVIGWGKTVVQMVNRLRKTQPTIPCHKYTCNLCLLGGGEKLGRPILSPPWLVIASILCRS